MKNSIKILSITTAAVLTLSLTGVAITYAAYQDSAPIGPTSSSAINIVSEGYQKHSIFLDVSATWEDTGNGNSWTASNAVFFLWAWVNDGSSGTKNMFQARSTVNKDGYYVFHIPTYTFTHCLFARADPSKISDVSWDNVAVWRWNQTGDLSLYSSEKTAATKEAYSYNLFKITSLEGEGSWQAYYTA